MKQNRLRRSIILLAQAIILFIINITCHAQGNPQIESDSSKTATEALKLIHMPAPTFESFQHQEMDSAQIADLGFEQVYESEPVRFPMRDGAFLAARRFRTESNTTMIVLHGILGSSYTYNRFSGLLREASNANVFALDLRGHGLSAGTPGDVDYTDQYADDLADVISDIRKNTPNERIILVGHSMGGGIALRYAMKDNVPKVDGYLLFAPNLGHTSPTQQKSHQGDDSFLKIHLSRIVGLYMLNSVGIQEHNALPVLFFNLPEGSPVNTYTYRSNLSMAPEDYKEGLRAVDEPLLVIVGSKDEAFVASEYEPVIKGYSEGKVIIVEDATHNGIRHEQRAMDAVQKWFGTLNLIEKTTCK